MVITVPPQPPTNLQVSGIGSRTTTLTWQAPVVTFLNSLTAVSSYQVTATQEQFANVSDIYVNIDANTTTYTFPQTLEEYTLYTCAVKASNAFGLGNATQPVTLRTLQAGTMQLRVYSTKVTRFYLFSFFSSFFCSSIVTTTVTKWNYPWLSGPFFHLVTTTTS